MQDYHDYVIKGGQFIGAFEAMYQHCEDPWGQSTMDSPAYEVILTELRGRHSESRTWQRILDLGCGLGRFTGELAAAARCHVVGVDISLTAVRKGKASTGNPQVLFVAADAVSLPFPLGAFDCVVSSELLWYVLPCLAEVLREIRRVLQDGGAFWALQHFYQPSEQRYGLEVMRGPEEYLTLMRQAGFSVCRTVAVDPSTNHKLIVFARKG